MFAFKLKNIFIILSILILILLPVFSFDYGIWWDEWLNTHYAEAMLRYFMSFGQDRYVNEIEYIPYYGATFDILPVAFYHAFKFWGIYETRHIFNSLFGAVLIIYAGLLAKECFDWRAAILTMILILISPVYLGNIVNNARDIPFATGFVMALYYSIIFYKEMPSPRWSTCLLLSLGFAVALGVRAGGLLSFCFFFLFLPFFMIKSENRNNLKNLALKTSILTVIGYFGGLVFWPLAHFDPLTIPYKALTWFTNIPISRECLFEGTVTNCGVHPWYYIPKFIFITSPMIIFLGLLASFFLLNKRAKGLNVPFLIIIIFTVVFPYIYGVVRNSMFYDGWRHMFFIYPGLVVVSAVSLFSLLDTLNNYYYKLALALLSLIFILEPVIWIAKNHPHEVAYFSPVAGGTKTAYSNYFSDNQGNSIRFGAEWLANYLIENNETNKMIYTNCNTDLSYYYLKDKCKVTMTREDELTCDYKILLIRGYNKDQILNHWPPEGTIHTVNADGITLCAVVKTN